MLSSAIRHEVDFASKHLGLEARTVLDRLGRTLAVSMIRNANNRPDFLRDCGLPEKSKT